MKRSIFVDKELETRSALGCFHLERIEGFFSFLSSTCLQYVFFKYSDLNKFNIINL